MKPLGEYKYTDISAISTVYDKLNAISQDIAYSMGLIGCSSNTIFQTAGFENTIELCKIALSILSGNEQQPQQKSVIRRRL